MKQLCYTLFYKQNIYKQYQAEIGGKKQAKAKYYPEVAFYYLKIIHILHPRYHPKITGRSLEDSKH